MLPQRKIFICFISNTGLVALLWLCRVFFSGSLYYGFLLWNLFLALIPFGISSYLVYRQAQRYTMVYHRRLFIASWWLLFIAWLLFFPNAPYIITDITHLSPQHGVPLWFDAALLFIAALTGLWIGCLSLLQMEKVWILRFPKISPALFVIFVLLLSGFGIYLGRVMRFNSWDVLQNPVGLASAILKRLLMPWQHLRTWGVTVLFAAILWVGYIQVKQIARLKF